MKWFNDCQTNYSIMSLLTCNMCRLKTKKIMIRRRSVTQSFYQLLYLSFIYHSIMDILAHQTVINITLLHIQTCCLYNKLSLSRADCETGNLLRVIITPKTVLGPALYNYCMI